MMNIRFVTLVAENRERLTSDQGTMLDLCLSVEGTESCGSDEEGRASPLVLPEGATSPHLPALARDLLHSPNAGCDL